MSRQRARSTAPRPDPADARLAPTIATAPWQPTRRRRPRAPQSAWRRSMRARLAAAAWSRTPDAMRARESLQREPALDDAAIGKLDVHADTARERLRRRARQRPAIAPAAVGRKLQDTKARDAAGERVSRRVFRCDVV